MSGAAGGGACTGGPGGVDGVVGSLVGNERLVEAAAMGVPAFVRRARDLEARVEALERRIRAERAERWSALLDPARRIEAARVAGAELADEVLTVLDVLRADERLAKRASAPPRSVERVARELLARAERFDRRWIAWIESLPLDELREAQADYNRYYPIERQCALRRAPRTAFTPVRLTTSADLLARFPPLRERQR